MLRWLGGEVSAPCTIFFHLGTFPDAQKKQFEHKVKKSKVMKNSIFSKCKTRAYIGSLLLQHCLLQKETYNFFSFEQNSRLQYSSLELIHLKY